MLALPTLLAPLLVSPVSVHAQPSVEPIAPAPFHCQVPCGIYGDHLRVELLREDAKTIEKAMNEIIRLGGESPVNYNQIVRWVTTKEEHAQKVQDQLAKYWLAQRVKRPNFEDSSEAGMDARRRYSGQLVTIHEMTVAAMKCKQTTNTKNVEAFTRSLESFRKAYFKPEDLEHIKHHAEDAEKASGGGGVVQVMTELEKAKVTKAKADLRVLRMAIDEFRMDNAGRFPESLEILVTADDKGARYLQQTEVPTDPWGHVYMYEPALGNDRAMRLFSLGADGKIGGKGKNADVTSDR